MRVQKCKIFLGKGSKNRFPGAGNGYRWGVKNATKSAKSRPGTGSGAAIAELADRRGGLVEMERGAGRRAGGQQMRTERENKKAPCITHGAGGLLFAGRKPFH